MTTKAPAAVSPAASGVLEKAAYAAVADFAIHESHDKDRLGYCVWLWLSLRRDSLEEAIRNAGVQLGMRDQEAAAKIIEALRASGVSV